MKPQRALIKGGEALRPPFCYFFFRFMRGTLSIYGDIVVSRNEFHCYDFEHLQLNGFVNKNGGAHTRARRQSLACANVVAACF